MSELYEIAYAAASERLCFLTGTGFSKAVTKDLALSWEYLLMSLCDQTSDPKKLKEILFPKNDRLPLEEVAQIISIELLNVGKNVYEETAKLVGTIKLAGDLSEISDFLTTRKLSVITTNYDKLFESLAGEKDCQSITPGLLVPRSEARIKVFHVHGSIDAPNNMVVTAKDYYNFINTESYFSRKLNTILHENTVVILGYSLSDNDLKAIISSYKGFSGNQEIGSSLFLISRSKIQQHIKEYYAFCFGIRVLDGLEICDFFEKLNEEMPSAEKSRANSITAIRAVLKGATFTVEYIKLENSFYEIIASLGAEGLSINDPRVVLVIGGIIQTKIELTGENNAWDQYEGLARWLIYLASILELHGTSIEKVFLDAVLKSMNSMCSRLITGYSWHAYNYWENSWSTIITSNRILIRNFIEKNTAWSDALVIVRR